MVKYGAWALRCLHQHVCILGTAEFSVRIVCVRTPAPLVCYVQAGKETILCQSKAIERYIAGQNGLFGASAEEAAGIDAIGELL